MKLNTKPLSEIETGPPIISEGVYFVRISDASTQPNKAKDGQNLVLTYTILDENLTRHSDGEEFENKGMKLMQWISLTPKNNYDPDEQVKRLATAIKFPEDQDLGVEDLPGNCLKVHVKYSPETEKYRASNMISGVYPITDSDNFEEPPY